MKSSVMNLDKEEKYPVALSLYFLCDNDRLINYDDILHDYNYALKDFIDYDQYNKIISEPDDLEVPIRESIFDYDGTTYKTNNFNLIYGLNASGKTRLMKHISHEKDIPLFLLNRKIDDREKVFYSSSQYLENFFKIIDYCDKQNIPLLLDDLCWNSFDGRNQVKIVDSLYEYSHNNDVFFTSAQDGIKELVKKRTHNPTIISIRR